MFFAQVIAYYAGIMLNDFVTQNYAGIRMYIRTCVAYVYTYMYLLLLIDFRFNCYVYNYVCALT